MISVRFILQLSVYRLLCQTVTDTISFFPAWGFRIYRTVYSPGSDADFEKALEILLAYMRFECFEDVVRSDDGDNSSSDISSEELVYLDTVKPVSPGTLAKQSDELYEDYPLPEKQDDDIEAANSETSDEEEGEIIDDRSNGQLWSRLKNDVVQDPSLDGISPAQLQPMFKQWVHASGAKASECSRYRFFIVMDSEVIENLLRVSLPIPKYLEDCEMYSVKVFDAEFNPSHVRLRNPESYHPKYVARLSKDEGWFWGAGWRLGYLFFKDRTTDREQVRTFDDQDRPLHQGAKY